MMDDLQLLENELRAESAGMNYLKFRVDAREFAKAIGTVKNFLVEGCFRPTDDGSGVELLAMDPSHVSLAHLHLASGDLSEYRKGEMFCVDIEELDKALNAKAVGTPGRFYVVNQDVELSVVGDGVRLNFPDAKREVTIAKTKVPMEMPRIPPGQPPFTVEAKISAKEFKGVLDDLSKTKHDNLRISADSEEIVVTNYRGDSGGKTYLKKFGKGDRDLIGLKVREPATAIFDVNYLSNLGAEGLFKDEDMTVSLGKDRPISIRYEMMRGSSLDMLLAPRVYTGD